ncbi:hypothetical protein [Nonomuraea jabiensis]|uniref:hypothetical protein n=1 Tax=Nonomuraea jabiensis TaxID=882448 RepID=UPI0036CC0D38
MLQQTNDVAFSPDGKKPAFAGADQRLLDAATGKPVTRPYGASGRNTFGTRIFFLHKGQGVLQSMAFTADGADIVTLDLNGAVHTHVVGPVGVIRAICRRAGGSLTTAEWKAHIPALPYRKSCP